MDSAPSLPGVYWFLDDDANVLYVGKAKNLYKRLYSYTQIFRHNEKTTVLVTTATQVKFQELRSEFEALLVEAELIRVHQPQYNILLKDDKSPLYIFLTDEKFPRILTAHRQTIFKQNNSVDVFGPFPSSMQVRYVLKMIRPIFRWCNEKHKSAKPCFYVHLHLCSGACAGLIGEEDYKQSILHLRAFLHGKTKELTTELFDEMSRASSEKRYEIAAQLRDKIQMIREVTTTKHPLPQDLKLPQLLKKEGDEMMVQLRRVLAQHIAIPKQFPLERIEGYDISNTQGTNPTASMVVATQGKMDPSQYRIFNITLGETPNDYGMMKEVLTRRQRHPEWGVPNLVVVDGGRGQLRAAYTVWKWSSPVCSLAKEPDRLFFYNPKTKTYTTHRLQDNDLASILLRRIRDESHRFAKKQHTKRRTQSVIK